jgi:hypothetical protein
MRLVGATASSKVPVWNFAPTDLTLLAITNTLLPNSFTYSRYSLFALEFKCISSLRGTCPFIKPERYRLVKATSRIRMSLKKRCLSFTNVAEPNRIRGPLGHAQMLSPASMRFDSWAIVDLVTIVIDPSSTKLL